MKGKLCSLRVIVFSVFVLIAGCISIHAQGYDGYYGAGVGADALGNTIIGGPYNMAVSYRLLADHTGALQSVTVYLIPNRPEYAAGTGGTIQVTVNADDGTSAHNPSSTVLASYVINNFGNLTPSMYFPKLTFPVPANLVDGQIYHIVFTNIDPDPTYNFMSVDTLCQANSPSPAQPIWSDADAAVLLYLPGRSWTQQRGYTPIVQLSYTDGWTAGIGYIEAWNDAPIQISGPSAVRESFTVTGPPRTAVSVSVRVAHLSGGDPLVARLEYADGTLIEEGYISADSIPMGTSPLNAPWQPLSYTWATYTFSSAHVLYTGQTYHIDFEASSSSAYQVFPVRKGFAYGFQNSTYFSDGEAEFKLAGNWWGWDQWGVIDRNDSDLQFYFSIV